MFVLDWEWNEALWKRVPTHTSACSYDAVRLHRVFRVTFILQILAENVRSDISKWNRLVKPYGYNIMTDQCYLCVARVHGWTMSRKQKHVGICRYFRLLSHVRTVRVRKRAKHEFPPAHNNKNNRNNYFTVFTVLVFFRLLFNIGKIVRFPTLTLTFRRASLTHNEFHVYDTKKKAERFFDNFIVMRHRKQQIHTKVFTLYKKH